METQITKNIQEKELRPMSGIIILLVGIIGIIASIANIAINVVSLIIEKEFLGVDGSIGMILLMILTIVICIFLLVGLVTVKPNEAVVLTLFGKYHGTIKKNGLFFVNPFATKFNPLAEAQKKSMLEVSTKDENTSTLSINKNISVKINTLNNAHQKVNDVQGNPVIIGSVVVWQVEDPTKAVFNVENYFEYLSIQCDAIMRNVTRIYPYDIVDGEDSDAENNMTLRGSSSEIAEVMQQKLQAKVENAGLKILEVKITHIAYAEEIAASMLKRQQATATIAAREKIVEGAVSMVQMALDKLEEDSIVILDDERKAAMVSNLLVVLCGDKEATPIVNSGSIY